MTKPIEIMDITIRDAQQCLWATRMRADEMTAIARTMERANFFIVDLMGGAMMDTAIMHMREDPFERLRMMRKLMPNTRINFNSRGQSSFRWRQYADDVLDFTFGVMHKNGCNSVLVIDAINDFRNIRSSVKFCKDRDMYVIGGVTYTISPVHTDQFFVDKTKEIVALGVDAVEIKDPSGLLTPERAKALVPAMKRAAGPGIQVQLHTHCTYGHGIDVYEAAMDLPEEDRPDLFHGAADPLGWGYSLPPHREILRAAAERGLDVAVNGVEINEIEDYFHCVTQQSGRPPGKRIRPQPLTDHQVPGGMMSNLEQMLADQGHADRLPEVLEEVARVRHDLGYPIMVSPLAQYVGTQAVFNVITGERYQVVPEEIRQYVLGWYGQLVAPVDPVARELIAGDTEAITVPPGELLEPEMEAFEREHGPFDSDEDMCLAMFYAPETLRSYRQARVNTRNTALPTSAISYLMHSLTGRSDLELVEVSRPGISLSTSF